MRDIFKIIDRIILVTPSEEVDFLKGLRKVSDDAKYTAPEDMLWRWSQLGAVFNSHIPYPPTHEWHDVAISVFTETDGLCCSAKD